jgi:hypothetical protein
VWPSTFGPLQPFADVRCGEPSARRGRRCPAGAHAVAVGAARRLHCDARPGVASQNSLRSRCSLRSNNCDESVYEARCARRPRTWPCRPRRAMRPDRSPGTSGPPDRSCPGSPSRRHGNRPRRAPPAALHRSCVLRQKQRALPAKDVGWLTQRSKGGGPGAARAGGHERSRPPDGLGSRQLSMRTAAMGRRRSSFGQRFIARGWGASPWTLP